MIGDIIAEFAGEIFFGLLDGLIPEPPSGRGRGLFAVALSSVGLVMEAYAVYTVGDPVHGPEWAFTWIFLGMGTGLVGFIPSLLNLFDEDGHRPPAVFSALLSVAAFLWPFWFVIR